MFFFPLPEVFFSRDEMCRFASSHLASWVRNWPHSRTSRIARLIVKRGASGSDFKLLLEFAIDFNYWFVCM